MDECLHDYKQLNFDLETNESYIFQLFTNILKSSEVLNKSNYVDCSHRLLFNEHEEDNTILIEEVKVQKIKILLKLLEMNSMFLYN